MENVFNIDKYMNKYREMAGVGSANGNSFFKDEEIRDLSGLVKREDFIEVTCGCTSKMYGDAVGRLKIFKDGDLEIKCQCVQGCPEGVLTPAEFEIHSKEKEAPRRWQYNIWVIRKEKKVPLIRTNLLKYHEKAKKDSGCSRKQFHHDEFVCCTKCNKERRFRLQNEKECRAYHDATKNLNWECSDHPFDKIICDTKEERAARKEIKGCPRAALCKGCGKCSCVGCEMCRFADCSCQICVDFITNADL